MKLPHVADTEPVQWRLQVCMANAGIRFASDLHRHLVAALGEDCAPSESQVSRLVRHRPERLNLIVLGGLCEVLDCEPGDLLQRIHHPSTGSGGEA